MHIVQQKDLLVYITFCTVLRIHFGSTAISVQVNIAAVSDRVFHSPLLVSCSFCPHFFFAFECSSLLPSCLNRVLLMHLAHRFPTHPCSLLPRIFVLLMDLAPTLTVCALGVKQMKRSMLLSKFVHSETKIEDPFNYELDVTNGLVQHKNNWKFGDSTYGDGAEFQCPHYAYT